MRTYLLLVPFSRVYSLGDLGLDHTLFDLLHGNNGPIQRCVQE